jgi:hypothetical protein
MRIKAFLHKPYQGIFTHLVASANNDTASVELRALEQARHSKTAESVGKAGLVDSTGLDKVDTHTRADTLLVAETKVAACTRD